jgi:hypothetical protein
MKYDVRGTGQTPNVHAVAKSSAVQKPSHCELRASIPPFESLHNPSALFLSSTCQSFRFSTRVSASITEGPEAGREERDQKEREARGGERREPP